jgi:hypothetical protein
LPIFLRTVASSASHVHQQLARFSELFLSL